MSLADEWHDPSGPLRPEPISPTAQDAVDFIRRTYIEAVEQRVVEAATSAGLSEEMIALILGEEA